MLLQMRDRMREWGLQLCFKPTQIDKCSHIYVIKTSTVVPQIESQLNKSFPDYALILLFTHRYQLLNLQ